jgi:hypothetical protein
LRSYGADDDARRKGAPDFDEQLAWASSDGRRGVLNFDPTF